MFTNTVKTLTIALLLALTPAVLADVSSDISGSFDKMRKTLKDQRNATDAAAADAELNAIDALGSGDIAAYEAFKKESTVLSENVAALEDAYARAVAAHAAATQFAADLAAKVSAETPKSKPSKELDEIQARHKAVRDMFAQRLTDYTASSGDVPSGFMIDKLEEGLDWLEYQIERLDADLKAL